MIEMKPKTLEEMKQIIGMGPSKIERYGKEISQFDIVKS